MPRVLIDGRVLVHHNMTGVERYAMEFVNCARRAGMDFDLAVPAREGARYGQVWEHVILPRAAHSYPVLFCPANIAPAFTRHPGLVTTLHSVSFRELPQAYSRAFRNYYKLLVPRAIKGSRRVIAVSSREAENILKHYPFSEGKLEVIYPGISEEFRPGASGREEFILYAGGMNPIKNLSGLLRAFAIVQKKIPHKLVIAGGGQGHVFSGVDLGPGMDSERIVFAGSRQKGEMAGLYRKASLLVFPSFYESFGFPPLEAMACGCPVVVSDIPALRETCGEGAFFVDPYRPEDIARGVLAALRDPGDHIRKGLENVKRFNWNESVRRHFEVFDGVWSARS